MKSSGVLNCHDSSINKSWLWIYHPESDSLWAKRWKQGKPGYEQEFKYHSGDTPGQNEFYSEVNTGDGMTHLWLKEA